MKRNLQPICSTGLMTWLAAHILSARLVYVLAVLVALGEPVRAAVATAAPARDESPASTSSEVQQLDPNLVQLCTYLEEKCEPWAPPPMLNLDQQVFFASPAQRESLRKLEKQAVDNIIKDHGLTDADIIAVQTWGRDEALAELFMLLALAVEADHRTVDQQNAVDWLQGIMKQKAIAAAENAGREYAKWAGLEPFAFETLLRSNPTQTQLRDFLDESPQFSAFCGYAPPTPYSSEYTAANHPICLSAGTACKLSPANCIPPTPTYDQFVKWGEAAATYAFLNSEKFSRAVYKKGQAIGLIAATAAGIAAGALVGTVTGTASMGGALTGSFAAALFPYSAAITAGAAFGIFVVVLLAIIIAVVAGIAVITATELPAQLAELINDARTATPDAKKLTDGDGAKTFFTIFVEATLPEPDFRACDNANPGLPPGITVIAGIFTYVGAPCLNPSAIPPPAATDLKFLVQEESGTTVTETPTISYRDAGMGAATTARLSKTWFVTTANETTTQRLTIFYTDWHGETRNAWLLGNASAGYTFVTFAPAETLDDTADLDPDTCDDNGTCSAGNTLEYRGSDGKNYAAKVRGPAVTTGEAKFSPTKPAEGSPQSFSANGFSFTDAVGPLTYEWRFQHGGCNFGTGGCMGPDPNGAPQLVPSYGDPVSGESVTHTWTLAGTFLVELTAIDSRGIKGSRAFPVTVENVPPTLLVDSECITDPSGIPLFFCNPRTVALGESVTMSGVFDDVGTGTYNRLTINWGDGTSDSQCISPPGLGVCFHVIVVGQPDPLQLGRLTDSYSFNGSHTYARPGSYYGAVTVNDPMGGSKSEPFLITIKGLAQSINFPGLAAHTFGDAPFGISATGGDSDQPVTFTVTGSQAVCALSGGGTGGVTVSLLKAGTCSITANQSGSGNYDPAASVTQSFTINRAPLTITASSPTITYGAAVPPITPGYSAFAGTESATSLDTQPTCSAASNGGAAGSYATSCTGAVDPNYDFNYMSGTLKIEKASTTLALTAAPATAVKGQPIAFTATVGITSPGATNPSGTVDFSDGGATIAGCAGLPVSAATNTATCTTSAMTVGSHSVTASYSGDTNFNSSNTAAAIASTVNKAATTTTASAPGTSIKGQSLTLTATIAVTAPGAGLPAGTVTFLDGTTSLGTGQLSVVNGKVQGSFSTSALALGRHAITARYGGNGDFTTSTSAPIIHYVNTDVSGFPTLAGGTYDLTNANLMSAYLVGVSLTGATVAGANFMGATLINADLTGADVSGSNFRNANFTGANLTGVRFSNTNLLGATGLSTATLTNVVWINTVCPNGRNSDRNGGSCEGQW